MKYNPNVPSSLLNLKNTDETSMIRKNFSDFSIKTGLILKSYDIDDIDNISKITVEYDVLAYSQEKDLGSAPVVYKRCQGLDLFGGIGDFFEFRRRTPTKNPLNSRDPQLEDGSMVMIMCANGNADSAYIVGATKHPKRKFKLEKDKGMHLEGEFNGINVKINDDGELIVTYLSKTDNNGTPENDEAEGSFFAMEKDGSIVAGDGNKEFIKINKTDKRIEVSAESNIENTTNANFKVVADKDIDVEAVERLLITAGGSASIASGAGMQIEAGASMNLKAQSLINAEASVFQVKAAAASIEAPTVVLGSGAGPVPIATTQYIGIGNLGAPVTSTAIGPFSQSVYYN